MAKWTKYFRPVNSVLPSSDAISATGGAAAVSKFSSYLPEVYQGPANRLQRYAQYDQMDADHDVHSALDTISEFSTTSDEDEVPFSIKFHEEPSSTEAKILKNTLKQWCELNEFRMRIYRLFRSTIKYGDQFFIRDPQTYKLIWVDPQTVERVIVNESEGKQPEVYYIKNLDLNLQELTGTDTSKDRAYGYGTKDSIFPNAPLTGQFAHSQSAAGQVQMSNYASSETTFPVDANHVVHISLTEGMDDAWPFGISELEKVFKVYKQKELLEESIIIYRVHRAPERRVFFIDTGTMPPQKAQQYLERVRYEVQQKRIPSRTGGGQNVMDASYNPMCLSLDTEIPLLDGRTLTLDELINEYHDGQENWIYSTNPETGSVVPGNITWAGVTRRNAETIKITLDNGETFTCTPDHKIPVVGKGYVEAQDLTENDPLISFETRQKSLSKDPNRTYQQVYDHELNKWIFTHRMVAEFFKECNEHQEFVFDDMFSKADKNTVHHVDYDRYNNNPNNLQWMNFEDHRLYHSATKKEFWENLSNDESYRIKNKIRKSLKKYRNENYEEFIKRYKDRDMSWIQDMKNNNPKKYRKWREAHGKGRSKYLQNNPEALKRFIKQGKEVLREKGAKNQELNFTTDMLTRLVEIVKKYNSNRIETIKLINNDHIFMDLLKKNNPVEKNSTRNIKIDEFTNSKLKIMYRKFGYKNWKDFKKKIEVYNHRIVKIEKDVEQDVGTITVDFQEKWHNYHTFAINAGIFVKNSMLEDYFFAQTSDGRGSKVDTLPGGEHLGEIDDLKYWNNKMFRALNVPTSYLPTGPDDGTAAYNDGRIGAAFIQEFRFTRYCRRLQQQVVDPLDAEFKLFLKHRDIEIDSSIFELKFNEPQNFQEYRNIELQSAYASLFTQLADVPYIANRYKLKHFLGWTEQDILENERLWKEEQGVTDETDMEDRKADPDLRQVGVTPAGFDNFEGDFEDDEEFEGEENLDDEEMDTSDDISDDDIDNFGTE